MNVNSVYFCRLSLKNIAYIGLRSVDPMERFIADKFNIKMLGIDVSSLKMKFVFWEFITIDKYSLIIFLFFISIFIAAVHLIGY